MKDAGRIPRAVEMPSRRLQTHLVGTKGVSDSIFR